MKNSLLHLIAACLMLTAATCAYADQTVEIRLKDGSTWRGEVADTIEVSFMEQSVELKLTGELLKAADLYIVIKGEIAGSIREKVIFKGDIVSIRDAAADEIGKSDPSRRVRDVVKKPSAEDEDAADVDGKQLGVFVLPLEGMVGVEFRHEEIEKMGEEADKYGPGQVIVLLINSNGGLVLEMEYIAETVWELKKRHRVVAWVKKAVSAGAATAMLCDEIYFMTEGSCGSVTTIRGLEHVPEEEVQSNIDHLVEIAKRSGYSEHIARAMKLKRFMVSYDKDPVTGEITWYNDTSGAVVLSDDQSNLCFTSTPALECGFSKGTADTEEDLAKFLDLPKWHEISDYGREIADDWQKTAKRAQEEIPRLLARLNYEGTGSGSSRVVLGKQLQILRELVRWWNRAPNVCLMLGVPPKEDLERLIERIKYQLANMDG